MESKLNFCILILAIGVQLAQSLPNVKNINISTNSATIEKPNTCKTVCGINALCKVEAGTGDVLCTCPPYYFGDPYVNCRPEECRQNNECPDHKDCVNNKCADPCGPTPCGFQARCTVVNHRIRCNCPANFTGDPFVKCNSMSVSSALVSEPTLAPVEKPVPVPTLAPVSTFAPVPAAKDEVKLVNYPPDFALFFKHFDNTPSPSTTTTTTSTTPVSSTTSTSGSLNVTSTIPPSVVTESEDEVTTDQTTATVVTEVKSGVKNI